MPYKIKECANTPYRPSNGTEGLMFRERFCDVCTKDINEDCWIYTRSLAFQEDEPEYPEEWRHDSEGRPTCTAFVQIGEVKPMTEAQIAKRDAARPLFGIGETG